MIRPALIFDFGNVVAFFDYEKATTKLGAHLGLSGREMLDRLGPLGFVAHLREYETGRLTTRSFAEQIGRWFSLDIPHEEFAAAWADIFTPNESIVPVIRDLKQQGYRLILGSNTNDLHAAHFREQFRATMDQFDHLVLSHEVGHVKPSREFYLACSAAAGSDPADCLFIDDLPANIAGARAAGLIGIVYESTAGLIRDLATHRVIVNNSLQQ